MRIKSDLWALLILPPAFFFLSFVGLVFYLVLNGLSENEISNRIADGISIILFTAQLFMLFLLLRYAKKNHINLISETFKSSRYAKDIIYGVLLGLVIALSYFKFGLVEFITHLQLTFGDYVPAGETSKSVSNNIWVFFLANVLLAPFVEENIYRNVVFKKLKQQFNLFYTVMFTAFSFGLLHWLGGFWYILVTAIIIGIPFGLIQSKRDSILLVFVAHFTLNLTEFLIALS